MKVQVLSRFRVAIPLTSRCVYVVAPSVEVATRVVLHDTGMLEGRTLETSKEGANWAFFKVTPPLPASWLGDCDVPTSVVNPKSGEVSCIEAEYQGDILVSLPESEVLDE